MAKEMKAMKWEPLIGPRRAKNRKSGAFWCILVHDLWSSSRRPTTGGVVLQNLEGCATSNATPVKISKMLRFVASCCIARHVVVAGRRNSKSEGLWSSDRTTFWASAGRGAQVISAIRTGLGSAALCFSADPRGREQGGQCDPGPERHDQQRHADPARAASVANVQAGIMKETKSHDRLDARRIGGRQHLPAGSMIFSPRAAPRGELNAAARKLDPEGSVRTRLQAHNVAREIGACRHREKGDEEGK